MLVITALTAVLFFQSINAVQKWEGIQTKTPLHIQQIEVEKLLKRLIPHHAHLFKIEVLGQTFAPKNQDKVTLTTENISISNDSLGQNGSDIAVHVVSNTGVAAAWGIHHYLKYFCNSHISWDTIRIGKIRNY